MAAPLITAITTVPNRANATDQASFSNDTDTFFSQVDGFQTQANTQAQYLDGVAVQVDANAATALSAKNSAVGAANYKGDWSTSSDVKQGESYTYQDQVWIAKQDSVDVTPVDGAFWLEGFGNAVDVRYDNNASGLAATDVQGAIDEVETRVDEVETRVDEVEARADEVEARVDVVEADILTNKDGITTLSTPNNALTKAALNATGAAPIYACRAWVNFDGTGTVAIRASGNVSSITDNGTGDYTVNFATAMPDANYVVSAPSTREVTENFPRSLTLTASLSPKTSTSCRVQAVQSGANTRHDVGLIDIAIFR